MAQDNQQDGRMPWNLEKNLIDHKALPYANDRKGQYRVRKEVEELIASRDVDKLTNADIIDFELREMYGKRYLSTTESRAINDTLSKMGETAITRWAQSIKIYNRVIKPIGNEYVAQYCLFEKELNRLTGDVALWISYHEQAKNLTKALRFLEDDAAHRFIVELDDNLIGAKLVQDGDAIKVKADGEGNLYEEIIAASRDLAIAMKGVRNIDTALFRYLHENGLEWMLPMNVQSVIPMVYYYRSYLSAKIPDKYFMSEVKKKRDQNISLSDEELEMAVFPDFYAVQADEECVSQYIERLRETNEFQR